MLCVQNGRRNFKQVHFYSVFLSICYIAQNQCVFLKGFTMVYLLGLHVSNYTVFYLVLIPIKTKIRRAFLTNYKLCTLDFWMIKLLEKIFNKQYLS